MKDKMAGKLNLQGILKNKYALAVLAVGLLLLLWQPGGKTEKSTDSEITAPTFSLTQEEDRLESQLTKITGAGRVAVLLSVSNSISRELAESAEGTLVVSENGRERVVELYYVNPDYLGAVIVCDGADSADVRLKITKAVSAFTGLGADRISIISMEK